MKKKNEVKKCCISQKTNENKEEEGKYKMYENGRHFLFFVTDFILFESIVYHNCVFESLTIFSRVNQQNSW